MSTALEMIASILSQVPQGTNPWVALRVALRDQVQATSPDSFRYQLYCVSAVLVIVPLTLMASLLVRFRQRSLWFVRMMPSSRGKFIVPHYLSCWSFFMVFFLWVLQGYIWKTISFSSGKTVRDIALWKMLPWVPAYLGFWAATMSLAVTRILHLDSSGRPLTSFFTSAAFINTLTLGVPVAVIISIAVLTSAAHDKYTAALDTFAALDTALVEASLAYNGTLDTLLLNSGVAAAASFLSSIDSFSTYLSSTFWMYFVWLVLLHGLFTTVSFLHLRELRRTMDGLANRSQISLDAREQEATIEKTYNQLVGITYLIFVVLSVFNACFCFVAASARKTVSDPKYAQVASLLAPYMFAVLGLPLSIMLFNRAVVNTKAGSTHDVSPGDTDRTSFTHLQPPTTISMTGANMVNGRDRLSKEYYSPVIENSSPSHGQDQAEEAYAMSSITTPTVYSPGSMPYSPTTTPSSVGNSTLGGEGKTIESPKAGPPSQRSLVPAAEPMPERIPSYYATRPAY